MKIEIEVSDKNEGTDSPYWVIIDPKQNMSADADCVASMITGVFFSRESAQKHLDGRRYAFSKRAVVYCLSGYWSREYKNCFSKSSQAKIALRTLENINDQT